MKPSVAIVGASANRHKFGNMAVRAYDRQGWEVFPVHPSANAIEGHRAYRTIADIPRERLDRITVYLPPEVGLQVVDSLASKPATDVWFNPGAASRPIVDGARALGLNVQLGCSIVAIGVSPHELEE